MNRVIANRLVRNCGISMVIGIVSVSCDGVRNRTFAGPEILPPTVLPLERLEQPDEIATSAAEAENIKHLIHDLARISMPDFGLSPTMTGSAFAPVAGSERAETMLLTDHNLDTDPAFMRLVKLGPKALPFLLEALDDKTETRLVIKPPFAGGMGGMWFANELRGNPVNTNEQKILATNASRLKIANSRHDEVENYTVKVGDVCFVAIGQIVGREYLAVRYQPSAIVVINSPTHDADLARQVRAIWTDPHPAQHLFDSLMLDYSTRGTFNGQSLDGWGIGSEFQISAAMRLFYYFPQQSAPLIAKRLDRFDVRGVNRSAEPNERSDLDFFMHREVSNGVQTKDFIKAVSWADEPSIQSAVQGIFERTSDPDLLLAAAVAVKKKDGPAEYARLAEFISKLPETEQGPFGDGYNLMVVLGKDAGDAAKPTFINYMQNASLQRRRSMCRVLLETQGKWAVELLAPLLDDKRSAEGWTYAVVPGQNEPRLPIRICDEAAVTIAHNFPKLPFEQAGKHENLDRQIQAIKARIASKDF